MNKVDKVRRDPWDGRRTASGKPDWLGSVKRSISARGVKESCRPARNGGSF